jgi:rRNA maturation endonuclease Nob1
MAPFARRPTSSRDLPEPARRPHAGLLRRERRALLDAREELVHKTGGLMVEMYRRNEYRDDLLAEVCAEVLGIDARVAEIDVQLADRRHAQVCTSCGATVTRGSHYCPTCGRDLTRPVEPAPPPGEAP